MRLVVFDLDGTLIDTGRDIAHAVNHALGACGRAERDVDEIRSFLGAGARRLVELAFDTEDSSTVDHGLALFSGFYRENLVVDSCPYPGIEELLAELGEAGLRLAVLSNKPHALTGRVIEQLLGSVPWTHVIGHRSGHERKPDPAGLLEICREVGVEPGECAMVGDTHFDLGTAIRAGADPIAVTWGGTPADVLRSHGAAFVAEGARDISRRILGDPTSRSF